MKAVRRIALAAAAALLALAGEAQQADWDLDSAFQALASYAGGDDRAALDFLEERVGAASTTFTLKRDLEARFLSLIQQSGTSTAARDFALSQLYRVATDRCVEVLEPLLYNPDTSEMARIALEKVPVNTATDALIKAMQKTKGSIQAGIIYSLGERRDARAAEPITKYSGKGDSEVVRAAIWALGEIGGPIAEDDLRWCRGNTLREHRDFAAMALIRVADRYAEEGDTEGALGLYDLLFIRAEPAEIRALALQGLLRTDTGSAVDTVIEILRTDEPEVQQAALRAVRELPGADITKRFAEVLPGLPVEIQGQLMLALADRGDTTALPAIHTMLRSGNAGTRYAAIEALGKFGDATSAAALVALMLRPGNADSDQVRAALVAMTGPGVDDELVEELTGPNNRVKSEIVKVLIARGTSNATAALIRVAKQDSGPLQLQALEGLSQVASTEAIPLLVDFMVTAQSAEARDAARQAITNTLERSGRDAGGTSALIAAMSSNTVPVEIKLEVLAIITISTDDAAVPVLAQTAKEDDGALGLACLDALADWPSNAALGAMPGLVKLAKRDPQRAVWVSAYTKLLARSAGAATLDQFDSVADAVRTREEKEALLEAVRVWGLPAGTAITERFLDDPEIGSMAAGVQQELGG